MSMYRIGLGFQGIGKPLQGSEVTARGLHGVLYHVLKMGDSSGASWLHHHESPKPYNLVPYYAGQNGILAGIRVSALTERSADLMLHSWEKARQLGYELRLGQQSFYVNEIACIPGTTFEMLSTCPPEPVVGLRFLSPTSFQQGPGHIPLPVPGNVFSWPFRVWNAYAPAKLRIPTDWLDWCRDDVFIIEHDIETAAVTVSRKEPPFTGFVGEVWFEAQSKALLYLSLFQGLANLTAYSGVGHKTTMGMGAVERIDKQRG